MGQRINYKEGDRIGTLWFIEIRESKGGNRRALFLCECGNPFETFIFSALSGHCKSCGCKKISVLAQICRSRKVHGHSIEGSEFYREYKIWTSMIQRCYNKNDKGYKSYGGRGIRVCDKWRDSFENFISDIGIKPSNNHSLDRFPDNNGDYRPGNTRWATRTEQANNRRTTHIIVYKGVPCTIDELSRKVGIRSRLLYKRIFTRKWSVEKAVETPLMSNANILKAAFIILLLFFNLAGFSQSESHSFLTYDTTITIPTGGQWSAPDVWIMKIARPNNTDTAARPAFITMNGQGELGTKDTSKLNMYGPFYWLNRNGWDGSVVLGNGKHYPIMITCQYTNNVYPTPGAYFNLISLLANTYHIKKGSIHLAGLSQGAFTGGGVIEYEKTPGDQAGMKLINSVTLFEGTPTRSAAYPTAYSDTAAFKIWAQKYGGRFFYLEGSGADNFRDGYFYATAMNNVVPGSAYFSYENINGGNHSGWEIMYSPFNTNWSCVPPYGPNNAPSQAGKNQMGNYIPGENVFQWMLRQGDTTLVSGAPPVVVPPVNPCPVCPKAPKITGQVEITSDSTGTTLVVYFDDGTVQTKRTP